MLRAVDALEYSRRGVAEFIGVFALIFIGATAGLYNDLVATALSQGFVIAVFVSAFAGISGGHFNPAVTLGFLVTRRIPALQAVFYWIVQFGAAALAALLLKWIFPSTVEKSSHLGAPTVNAAITSGKAVTIEAVCTFFLVIVVFATAVDAKGAFDKIAGLAIGLTIALGIMMAGPLTGGALNPARAFGPGARLGLLEERVGLVRRPARRRRARGDPVRAPVPQPSLPRRGDRCARGALHARGAVGRAPRPRHRRDRGGPGARVGA